MLDRSHLICILLVVFLWLGFHISPALAQTPMPPVASDDCVLNGGECKRIDEGCGTAGPSIGACGTGQMCCKAPVSSDCVARGGECKRIDEGCGTAGSQPGTCSGSQVCCKVAGTTLPPGTTTEIPVLIENPLKFKSINELLTSLLTYLQGFIVTLALIFMIIGAFLYITSAGNEGRMETGKKAILAALIGLALGIAAPAFLREIASILGWASYAPVAGFGTELSLLEIIGNVLSFLLTIIGIIAIIMLILGGFMYLTSAGNEDQIDRGKKIVKYSLIGITVALAALVLVKQVAKFFSAG